jgi:hypothetical protein
MRSAGVAVAAVLVAGGCGSKHAAPVSAQTRHVSWPAFRQAILDCRVTYVEQDHNRYVVAKLDDNTKVWSTAPRTDAIFVPLRQSHCKHPPVTAEE